MNIENTVNLELKKYNELRDFKKNVEENNFICYHHWDGYYGKIDKEDIINNLKNKIKTLKEEISDFKNPKDKETTVKDLEQMNLFELVKWKLKRK